MGKDKGSGRASHDVSLTSFEAEESGKVNGLLRVILGEGLYLCNEQCMREELYESEEKSSPCPCVSRCAFEARSLANHVEG